MLDKEEADETNKTDACHRSIASSHKQSTGGAQSSQTGKGMSNGAEVGRFLQALATDSKRLLLQH